jgi:hypothetical protein
MSRSFGAAAGELSGMARIGNCLGSNTRKELNMSIVNFVLTRLKEPSTYAGLSGLALALGVSSDLYAAASSAVAAVAGLVAIVLAEKAK